MYMCKRHIFNSIQFTSNHARYIRQVIKKCNPEFQGGRANIPPPSPQNEVLVLYCKIAYYWLVVTLFLSIYSMSLDRMRKQCSGTHQLQSCCWRVENKVTGGRSRKLNRVVHTCISVQVACSVMVGGGIIKVLNT